MDELLHAASEFGSFVNGNRVSGFGFRVGALTLAAICVASNVLRAQPQKGYDVHYYNATIRLDRAEDSLWGQVTMMATVEDSIVGILQFEKYLVLDSVFLNGVRTNFAYAMDTSAGAYIVADTTLFVPGSQIEVTTYYHGKGQPEPDSWAWGGVSDEDNMMFSMGVGFQVPYTSCTRYWLPSYDLPDAKPDSVDLTFITPASDITASNGLLVSNTVTPNTPYGAERIMHWHVSRPIATYLLTFATGPLTEQDIPNALGIPFQVYALAGDSAEASMQMRARVAPVLAFYDSLFAPYPFEKVGYVVTPIGSMEHQTMISLDVHALVGDSASMAADTTGIGTVAIHELSHQWWGDRVTCKTFDDAWLNEGFAQYCESLVLERLFGREKYISRQHINIASAKANAYYPLFGAATADNHSNNYPPVIYVKGASVLGMLRQYLGDSLFFAAIRYYGNTHAYGTVTSYDLWNDFDTVTGQDLGWFFKPWVFGTGYPKDTIVWSKTANGASIAFHQVKNNATTPYFRMPIPVEARTNTGITKTVTVWMDSVYQSSATATFGFTPDTLIFDPDGLLMMRIVKVTQVAASVSPEEGSGNGLRLRAFPNPDSQNMLKVTLDASRPVADVVVTLSDEKGQILRSVTEHEVAGHFALGLSLAGLSDGNYILSASAGSQKATQKVAVRN